MRAHLVNLKHGLKLGDKPQMVAELHEATAGMLTEARIASERVVHTHDGKDVMLLASPNMARRELMRRQIFKIGEIPADPLSDELFDMLHSVDFNLIELKLLEIDQAALKEVAQMRGRDKPEG